jgi:hypothetical protein
MFSLNLFLGHFIGEHAFSNVYSEAFTNKKGYYKHLIWIVLLFLALTFDSLLSSGAVFIVAALLMHVGVDLLRMKKKSSPLLEFTSLIAFLLISFASTSFLKESYISWEFQLYLCGMMISTSFGSYLFRTFGLIDREKKDTTGATERLVIFIFMLAHQYLWVFLSALIAVGYKLIIEKRKDKELLLSPVYGILTSLIWMFIM